MAILHLEALPRRVARHVELNEIGDQLLLLLRTQVRLQLLTECLFQHLNTLLDLVQVDLEDLRVAVAILGFCPLIVIDDPVVVVFQEICLDVGG